MCECEHIRLLAPNNQNNNNNDNNKSIRAFKINVNKTISAYTERDVTQSGCKVCVCICMFATSNDTQPMYIFLSLNVCE